MKLKSAIKYQLYDVKKPVIIFYIVIYSLSILSLILANILVGSDSQTGGFELATAIFIFIVGLNWFKDSFRMLLQNGVSRLIQFKAMAISIVILSFSMNVIDLINRLIFSIFQPYVSIINELASEGFILSQAYQFKLLSLSSFILQLTIYILAGFIGLFITSLYARMNKGGKIAVSISVPAFFIIAVPILYEVYNIRIFEPIAKLFSIIFGNSPYLDSLILLVFASILACLMYLLTRRISSDSLIV